MNVLTPTLGLGVGYSEQYVQLSKCSNVRMTALIMAANESCPPRIRPGWGRPPDKFHANRWEAREIS